MKCISVSQPFADLIVSGAKSIELRRWSTRHRGDLLVHAPLKVRKSDCIRLGMEVSITGAIIGRVRLDDVKRYSDATQVNADAALHLASREFESSMYGFVLKDPIRFQEPIPWKGHLGIFEVNVSINTEKIISDVIEEDYRYRLIGWH